MKTQAKSLHELPVFIRGDQPTNCPQCGARTDFIEIDDSKQQHKCLNNDCGFEFFEEEDNESEYSDEYKNQLLHGVLGQIEQDLENQDYEALDELLQALIDNDEAKDLLWNYLGEDLQEELNEFSIETKYQTMDICVITDTEGNLQGVIPIPTTTGDSMGLIKLEGDIENFKKSLIEYVNEWYWDETEILDVEISPRFYKYEQTEAKFKAEDDEFFHLNIQLTGVSTTPKTTFLLQRMFYSDSLIAVVHASTDEELERKCLEACKEEFYWGNGIEEIRGLSSMDILDWGVSSCFAYCTQIDGIPDAEQVKITKVINY